MIRLPNNTIQWVAASLAGWILLGTSCAAYGKTIHNDTGGVVSEYITKIADLRESGERVEIRGHCMSACTLYMGLPNACTTRGAIWGFHGPSAATQGMALPLDEFERVSQIMAGHYRGQVRAWFLSTGRYVIEADYYEVSGATLIDMGAIDECN